MSAPIESVRAAVHLAVRNTLTFHYPLEDRCSCGHQEDPEAQDLHPTAELTEAVMRGIEGAVDTLAPVTDTPSPDTDAIYRALAAAPVGRGDRAMAEHIAGCLAGSREAWVPAARRAARTEGGAS